MSKENVTPIKTIHGIEIKKELFQNIVSEAERNEDAEIEIGDYLLNQLGIEDKEIPTDKKELIQKNFIHLICQVLSDLNMISERLRKYKEERLRLEGVKTNEAEYRRRKLEYFAKLNKNAQNDIVIFLDRDIKNYILETNYDTLQREKNMDELEKMFRNRRYLFAQASEYYDADFDYSTVVKVSRLPGIDWIDELEIENKYVKMHRDEPEKYYDEIKKLITQKRIMENLKTLVEKDYHLYKRREIFMDLARLYEEEHYQSFLALGLIQLEGLFFDICSIRYEEKENAGTLIEKAEKALKGKNQISYMRYFPYFAFDVPIKRNEIAHTGLIKSQNFEQLADELLLDLNAVTQIAKLESDGKFRIFIMINNALCKVGFSDPKAVNKKLILELFATRDLAPESFWEVLKSPEEFQEEIEFYKQDISADCLDLQTIVKRISNMVYQLPFWCEMVNILNDYGESDDVKQFMRNMAKNYVSVLNTDTKEKCIEVLKISK